MSKKKVAADKEAQDAAAAAAAAAATNTTTADRNVVLGVGSESQKTNQLLQDVIHLHRLVGTLQDTQVDQADVVERLYKLVMEGKAYELAGWKDVPSPFMRSGGTFVQKDGTGFAEMDQASVKVELAKMVKAELEEPFPVTTLQEAPYKQFKDILARCPDEASKTIAMPQAKDVILLHKTGPETDKIFDQQSSNKAIFSLGSQFVTSFTNSPEKRVEAALAILQGIDEAEIILEDSAVKDKAAAAAASNTPPPSKVARFLVRAPKEQAGAVWSVLDTVDAIEFVIIFVFEVFLEKGIHTTGPAAAASSASTAKPGTVPINEPTDHDVLFGRGGMTNSHGGNRRFRDVIALHRPDYIRAIKMDKPAVARKIVKAIRQGIPPGRFLKKGEDGKWYDVGDRTAAEKTSQGLRERSNAEKRQRSALREALRIRKEDMSDGGTPSANKKAKTGDSELASLPATQLNYVGTNLAVPLSLSMKDLPKAPNGRKKAPKDGNDGEEELNTEGLPPNATDAEGNILVTDYDILCGRGGLTNHHKGNKRFRDVVTLHRPDYVRAPKIQKPSVARVIVRAIRNGDPPGRFLRKDDKSGKWIDIGDKKAAEKTSQALREKTNEERDKLKASPGALGVGVLLPNPASYLAAATAAMVPDASPAASKKSDKEDTGKAKKKEVEAEGEVAVV